MATIDIDQLNLVLDNDEKELWTKKFGEPENISLQQKGDKIMATIRDIGQDYIALDFEDPDDKKVKEFWKKFWKKYGPLVENMHKNGATYQEILVAEEALKNLTENENAEPTYYDILDNMYYKYCRKSSKSRRQDILEEAITCVCGQREQDYGSPESNFQIIADLWNVYLGDSLKTPVTSTDVAMMMALLKIARIRNGGGTGDSFVDLAGYAACGGELNEK